jgi:hypothetical protein
MVSDLHHPLTITDKSADFVPGMGYFVLFLLGLAAMRQKKRDACLHPAMIKTHGLTITGTRNRKSIYGYQ